MIDHHYYKIFASLGVCNFCPRWMASGESGVHLEIALEVVVVGFSLPRESVTTPSLRMEANTVMAFASNIAPVTSTLVLKQVH